MNNAIVDLDKKGRKVVGDEDRGVEEGLADVGEKLCVSADAQTSR
jgi:hypothetical protein